MFACRQIRYLPRLSQLSPRITIRARYPPRVCSPTEQYRRACTVTHTRVMHKLIGPLTLWCPIHPSRARPARMLRAIEAILDALYETPRSAHPQCPALRQRQAPTPPPSSMGRASSPGDVHAGPDSSHHLHPLPAVLARAAAGSVSTPGPARLTVEPLSQHPGRQPHRSQPKPARIPDRSVVPAPNTTAQLPPRLRTRCPVDTRAWLLHDDRGDRSQGPNALSSAVGHKGPYPIWFSLDGWRWTRALAMNGPQPRLLTDVTWTGLQFAAVGRDARHEAAIWFSPDGQHWVQQFAVSRRRLPGRRRHEHPLGTAGLGQHAPPEEVGRGLGPAPGQRLHRPGRRPCRPIDQTSRGRPPERRPRDGTVEPDPGGIRLAGGPAEGLDLDRWQQLARAVRQPLPPGVAVLRRALATHSCARAFGMACTRPWPDWCSPTQDRPSLTGPVAGLADRGGDRDMVHDGPVVFDPLARLGRGRVLPRLDTAGAGTRAAVPTRSAARAPVSRGPLLDRSPGSSGAAPGGVTGGAVTKESRPVGAEVARGTGPATGDSSDGTGDRRTAGAVRRPRGGSRPSCRPGSAAVPRPRPGRGPG